MTNDLAHDLAFSLDPAAFAEACGITPDPWQRDLLRAKPHRGLLCCSRQSGKSTVTGLLALHTALYSSGSLVVIVSPSQRQSGEMLRSIRSLYTTFSDGGSAPRMDSESVLKIELGNGSRIVALPGTERTIRGMTAALVVIDEAARTEDSLLQAVRPMTAASGGAIVALTTPAGKRGWFFDAWHGPADAWHRVRVPASECPRISKEFLTEELRELGPTRFSEEYDLAFVDTMESAFPTGIIDRAFTSELAPLW